MTQPERPKQAQPTRTVAQRVKEVRGRRGLSAAALADRLNALGINWDRSIVANLESGRRLQVNVDELLALGAALNVAPIHLLVSPEQYDEPYEVAQGVAESALSVRAWIRGAGPLDDEDPREFYAEVPRREYNQVQMSMQPRGPDQPYGENPDAEAGGDS